MATSGSIRLAAAAAQVSSGLILGLSSVIYAISYAALMFPGSLAALMPHAISVTLITAIVGGLYGLIAEEPTLVNGPDASTSSVLAGMMVVGTAATLPGDRLLNHALALLLVASLVAAAVYLVIERCGLARLVRFIPFQVMAGFLASTGWLMASGALAIMAGTPLNWDTVQALHDRPLRPELLLGLALTGLLMLANRRWSQTLTVPVFIVVVSLLVNLATYICPDEVLLCETDRWFFQPFERLPWTPPWELQLDRTLLRQLAELAPSFLAVAFVGTMTLLLSLSSLEHTYQRDFHLEPALRAHGMLTLASAALGGYLGLISVGRTLMCRQTGGGRVTGLISAAVCLGVLLGLAAVLAWVPKVALGAIVLVVGLGMLRQWFWDLRHTLTRPEWLQILGILVCVVGFGYVVGFTLGLLAACIFFVVTYSRMPSIRGASTLAVVRSSVIRDVADQQYLTTAGATCRVGRFDGYVFFGVAHSIYEWYCAAGPHDFKVLVLDFSHARGMDHSAATVIGKILRAEAARAAPLILALSAPVAKALRPELQAALERDKVAVCDNFDAALERAEDLVLAERGAAGQASDALASPALRLFPEPGDRAAFGAYLQRVELGAGVTLFGEGQASSEMYFIEAGRLEVVTLAPGHTLRLAKVVAGSMIGEMALYSGQPRTATVRAVDDAVLLMLTLENWQRMQLERPDLARQLDLHVIRGLAARVSRANAALSQQEG